LKEADEAQGISMEAQLKGRVEAGPFLLPRLARPVVGGMKTMIMAPPAVESRWTVQIEGCH